MQRRLNIALAAGVLAVASVAPGCLPTTGAVVEVMLGASCTEPLPAIVELRAEVLPCVSDAGYSAGYRCTVSSADELVALRQDRFPVTTKELSGPDPVRLLIEDLGGVSARGVERIRLALSALDADGLVVAFGSADVTLETGVIVQQADPLVIWTTCGVPAGTDYDGDGAVAEVDCKPFDATSVGNLPEICDNGIDEDCYLGDAPCEVPTGNPADTDDDGYCAIGAELLWVKEKEILAFCSVNGFTDCDDLDPSVRDVCRCTDLDGDGYCAEPATCVHDPASICNPFGGDCCDGGSTDWACAPPPVSAFEVNPGAAEVCNDIDSDCSGDPWNVTASPCYAEGAAGAACQTGLLCDLGGGAYGCVVPAEAPPAADAALCGDAGVASPEFACVECDALASWDGTIDGPCADPSGEVLAQIQVTPLAPVIDCSWEVITPSWPLVVTEAPAGSGCTTGLFDVELTAIEGPGLYAVYLRYNDLGTSTSSILLVLVPVEAGTCAATPATASCEGGNGMLCSYW